MCLKIMNCANTWQKSSGYYLKRHVNDPQWYISWWGLCATIQNSGKGTKAIFMYSNILGTGILTENCKVDLQFRLGKVFSGFLGFGYCPTSWLCSFLKVPSFVSFSWNQLYMSGVRQVSRRGREFTQHMGTHWHIHKREHLQMFW